MINDFILVMKLWGILFLIGIIFLPLTNLLFKNFKDRFYVLSKVLGISIISYTIFLLGTLRILPFSLYSAVGILVLYAVLNFIIFKRKKVKIYTSKLIIFEELMFFACILFWSYVRAHEPSVHGLEKFMDFGFINSILRTDYFPPKDMWFTPFPINYYFFGHLCAAVLTKFSGISSNITYNLMIATIFSFTFTGAFSIIYNLLSKLGSKKSILGGLIGGALLSLGGNIHTIYSFFTAYQGEKPVPFWDLLFVPNSFPNGYWYPNATRFIPFTIHEFPIYSFVVSDLHGHVSDIPFVLLTGALLLSVLIEKNLSKLKTVVISLMLAIMYMTNVWDGIIYLLLFGLILLSLNFHLIKIELYKSKRLLMFPKIKNVSQIKKFLEKMIYQGGTVIILYFIFTLPFSINFKPFVSGIGILCPPEFLTNIKSLGPFIFEADHCQKSPLYQLFILYGFFYFFVLSFILFLFRIKSKVRKNFEDSSNVFVFLLIILGTVLIIVPEFLYAKDIYPQHYRANTMFKLVYQAFILLSLSSSYIIIYLFSKIQKTIWKFSFTILTLMLLSLVFVYPYYAISSYYGELKNYKGLDGLVYLKTLYSGDLEAINYLNKNISGQPVILEAQGDSYTDYARISANTGLPTVLGWTVHEWLWRGTYDIPSPRIDEVKKMYEEDNEVSIQLMSKYDVKYVIVGQLEKEKYPKIDEDKFRRIGKIIFKSSDNKTLVYEIKGL